MNTFKTHSRFKIITFSFFQVILPGEAVNWAPICDFSSEPHDFDSQKQVFVLGFRLKHYPKKPENKNFVVQLDGRQCDGKTFKQTLNRHFFYPVDGTFFSFKDPQGNLHSVSKILLYQVKFENTSKQ